MNDKQMKNERVSEIIREIVATFIAKESNNKSLITVTKVFVHDSFKKATIFVTVLPENQQNAVLDFLKRKKSEMREYLKKNGKLSNIPRLEIEIDRSQEIYDKLRDL